MACNSPAIRWSPKLPTRFGFHSSPFPLGPGSTSLLALIEREFTPWSSTPPIFGASRELINCTQRNVKKRMALGVIFFRERLLCCHFLRRKKHVGGLFTLSAAFFHVQHEIILRDIVIR